MLSISNWVSKVIATRMTSNIHKPSKLRKHDDLLNDASPNDASLEAAFDAHNSYTHYGI